MALMTAQQAFDEAHARLQAKGISPAIIPAILQALATVFQNFCGGTPPVASDMAALAKRGLSDCNAGNFTMERFRFRRALLNQGVRRLRGELDDAETACWQIAAETPPKEIERYAAVWAAEPQ